ncbi:hypothetical protein [Candidatus Villigracilis affinis]|uniref:hypothetical protein n=1 Tax=Candidatus Villigracilis affinis TaxID=3140682 RepID=UPI002A1A7B16|nr:hypothetical protein [Anaerolineales bacterium]
MKTFRLVGVIQQTLSPSSAYVLPETFASATNQPVELMNAVRVVMREHDKESSASITRDIEQALAVGNVSVKVAVSEALLGEAISGHVYIFIVADDDLNGHGSGWRAGTYVQHGHQRHREDT